MTTTTPTPALADLDLDKLEALARAATPQNFDSAQVLNQGHIECPSCDGSGEVELTADYCNYDGKAMGVQFYGIGPEHRAAEAFFRAANPAAVLDLIALARRAAQPVAPVQENSKREGFEAAAKALQERAAGHYRNGDDELQDECLQCASMLHDMKPALAAPSPQVADIADVAKFKQAFHEASRVGAGYDEAVAVGLAASRRAAATVLAELIEAADATVERWHSRDWKQPHTAEFINRLALAIGTVRGLRAPSPNNSPV